jgi:hypothetical protein
LDAEFAILPWVAMGDEAAGFLGITGMSVCDLPTNQMDLVNITGNKNSLATTKAPRVSSPTKVLAIQLCAVFPISDRA